VLCADIKKLGVGCTVQIICSGSEADLCLYYVRVGVLSFVSAKEDVVVNFQSVGGTR